MRSAGTFIQNAQIDLVSEVANELRCNKFLFKVPLSKVRFK